MSRIQTIRHLISRGRYVTRRRIEGTVDAIQAELDRQMRTTGECYRCRATMPLSKLSDDGSGATICVHCEREMKK